MANWRQWKKWLFGFVIGIVLPLIGIILWYIHTQTHWIQSEPYERTVDRPAKTLVVAYSRTGNTLGAAKMVAEYFDADLVQIRAPKYENTIDGLQNASEDAKQALTQAVIHYPSINWEQYDLVVLATPTWWFRPAVPMYAFIQKENLTGQTVLLLMTGNSQMKAEKTESFENMLTDQGATLLDTIFIKRGRIYHQLTADELNSAVVDELNARKHLWPEAIRSEMRVLAQ